ncbi:hypothetical protein HPP92_022051 [Vanilla planifolia]|uniref:E3 ubiquitin-protein ligase RMA n=1 Tax=Vanilla planifolia TaxID=51239 RepID=A0A835UBJ7_VANPL|nr:hypothetical protein HPP92_022051 [Vanilla planifolia]
MEEIEGTFAGCFSEFVLESPTEDEIPANKPASCAVGSARPPSACFDCNICLDFVTDPVVTLCGHLFCWPCIYRWLHLEPTDGDVSRNCPVCKSALSSEFSLVPLYGRGLDAKSRPDSHDVPERPKQLRNLLPNDANASFHLPPPTQRQSTRMSQDYLLYGERRERDMGILHSTAGVLLGEMALAVLPSALRHQPNLYTSLHQIPALSGTTSRRRRQESRAEMWLHQLWVFCFCCAVLFLLLF